MLRRGHGFRPKETTGTRPSGWPKRSHDDLDEHTPFGNSDGGVPKQTRAKDEETVRDSIHRRPRHDGSNQKRLDGVSENHYQEESHKTGALESEDGIAEQKKNIASTEHGVPRKYPWTDRHLTVQESRRAVLQAGKLAEEDREDLFDHIHKLHPQILLNRRRY